MRRATAKQMAAAIKEAQAKGLPEAVFDCGDGRPPITFVLSDREIQKSAQQGATPEFKTELAEKLFINPPLLTAEQISDRLGITSIDFRAMVKEGILPRADAGQQWRRKQLDGELDLALPPKGLIEPTQVYFIRADRFIKVGYSAMAVVRMKDLQTALPWDLELVLTVPGTLPYEQSLHRRLAFAHKRGEWFRETPGLLAFIRWLRKATRS